MNDIIQLARPYQYIKNLFVFAPAFFAFQLTNIELMARALLAFVAFSLVASSVYIINDWMDREADAKHPQKKYRPLAAGRITFPVALTMLTLFLTGGVLASFFLSLHVVLLIVVYFCLNLAYSLKLKHIAIIDVTVVAIGFVLRLFVGAQATQVDLSHWIIVMTFLLALFLALAKRRDDVLIYLKTNTKIRKVVDGYNLKFLDTSMMMSASIVVVAYVLWSISPEVTISLNSEYIYITAIFVVLGILRYMQITLVEEKSSNPSKILLEDRALQLIFIGWIASFVWIIYLV